MSALYHLMAHRRVASVHMQHGTPHRSGSSTVMRPDVPLVSLRDAPDDRDEPEAGPDTPQHDPITPWWYRVVLPLALVLSALAQVGCMGLMFGWWK